MEIRQRLDELKTEIGQRLREARTKSGIGSQATAAKLLSDALGETVEPSRIGNYEQGTRLPDPVTISALCAIYSTWPSAIYGFDEAPASPDESKLLERYRQTDDRGRRAIQGVAESQPTYDVSGNGKQNGN